MAQTTRYDILCRILEDLKRDLHRCIIRSQSPRGSECHRGTRIIYCNREVCFTLCSKHSFIYRSRILSCRLTIPTQPPGPHFPLDSKETHFEWARKVMTLRKRKLDEPPKRFLGTHVHVCSVPCHLPAIRVWPCFRFGGPGLAPQYVCFSKSGTSSCGWFLLLATCTMRKRGPFDNHRFLPGFP